ncbi:MAG: SDR family oxidoreductase [Verrucomicrobiota bacterium]
MQTIVITGANRGIGLEFCRQYQETGQRVIGVCRSSSDALNQLGVEVIEGIDVTSADSVNSLKEKIREDRIDVLINNAGILLFDGFPDLEFDKLLKHYDVNTLGPLRVTMALLDRLKSGSKLILITSRVGSLADNSSSGNYGYRMSKTALNMAGLNLSMDLKERGIPVALLHPGYVQTDMTRGGGLIDTDESVRGMRTLIENLNLENSGAFLHTNGDALAW